MRRRFFVEQFQDGAAVLRGDAAHHLGRVLRAEPGQLYELSDGQAVWLARTKDVRRDAVEFALLEQIPVREPRVYITLLLAIVKYDRMEWALEKATELGADEILPLAAARSEKGLIAAAAKRAARWDKILLESAQQSRRLRVPILHRAAKPADAFGSGDAQSRILLSEGEGAPLLRHALLGGKDSASAQAISSVALAIGPEGGWTDQEFAAARDARFAEASLGPGILRTETAACAALAAIRFALE